MKLADVLKSIDGAFDRRTDHLLDILMAAIIEDEMKADEAVERFERGMKLHAMARDKVIAAAQQNFKD